MYKECLLGGGDDTVKYDGLERVIKALHIRY